jgi:rare lipoprotein A
MMGTMTARVLAVLALVFVLNSCSEKESHGGYTSEARRKATMRCYTVLGKTYKPTYVQVGDTMKGVSSWYGPDFHGKQTSSGERYDMYAMTAAHKTWPMDTIVRVDNLDNGKSVKVRINDRGPFVKNRIIDCSYAAGKKLGIDKTGTARVKLTVLGFAGREYKPTAAQKAEGAPPPKVRLSDFAVQVGAFRRKVGAEIYRRHYSSLVCPPQHVIIREFMEGGAPLYRVWVTGFGSEDEARDFISRNDIEGGFIIRPR